MTAEIIGKMRRRVEQCRRLADWVSDGRTRETLMQMANEIEADMRQLESQTRSEAH